MVEVVTATIFLAQVLLEEDFVLKLTSMQRSERELIRFYSDVLDFLGELAKEDLQDVWGWLQAFGCLEKEASFKLKSNRN